MHERVRVALVCKENEGKTKQSFKDECDINKLMKRYINTGRLPDMIKKNPIYGDFSSSKELLSAYAIVEKAKIQFDLLDSSLRRRFKNDPALFLEFVENPENKDELIKLGLAKEEKKIESEKKEDTTEKVSDNS